MISEGKQKGTRRLVLVLTLLVVAMFGFGYLLVPLYNTMCEVLNINGKTDSVAFVGEAAVDESRTVLVEFISHNSNNLHWDFYPSVTRIRIHPGEFEQLSFYAKNHTDKTMVVQSIPSVTPGIAAKYLKKTECFCFEQQTLGPGEEMDMPLLFHLDPALPAHITTVTLSYSLFDVTNRRVKKSETAGRIA